MSQPPASDGLELATLGSGSAFSTIGHHSCHLLAGELLLDCGAPATRLLGDLGKSSGEISCVAVSHLHGDHLSELPTLIAARALAHPESPRLRVVGPPGTAERLDQLGRLAVGSHYWSHVMELQSPIVEPWAPGDSGELAGFRVRAYRMEHYPHLECLGFRFERDQVVFGYSGDTELCPGIRELAGEVQYLLCECTSMTGPAPGHLWRADVEELMREAPGARFILTHLSERQPVAGALLSSDGLVLRLRPTSPG